MAEKQDFRIKGISECEQVEWLIRGVNAYEKICRILIREGPVIRSKDENRI